MTYLITMPFFCTKQANKFYEEHHRTHDGVTNKGLIRFSVLGVVSSKPILDTSKVRYKLMPFIPSIDPKSECRTLGCVTFTYPMGNFKNQYVMELSRICFHKNFAPRNNKETKFYSLFVKDAVWSFLWACYFSRKYSDIGLNRRIAKKVVTYIHADQKGKYLEYAGFEADKTLNYSATSKGWNTRSNRQQSCLKPKIRYTLDCMKLPFHSVADLYWNFILPYGMGLKSAVHKRSSYFILEDQKGMSTN